MSIRSAKRLVLCTLLALGACGDDDANGPDIGPDASVDTGGTSATGGASVTGGTSATGGASVTGGTSATGGAIDPTLDRDGDGLTDRDEIERYGTSPIVGDTDGDGFSDKVEVVDLAFDREVDNFQFNPLIADRPILDVQLAMAPVIYATYEISNGTTETVGKERSDETRSATSRSWGGSNAYSVEQSHTVGTEVGFSGWSLEASVSYEYSYSTTHESSSDWSQEQTEENAQTLSSMQQFEQSNTVTSSGGVLGVTVRVSNSGNIAYFLDNLTLTAYELDPLNPDNTTPIGALTFLDTADAFPRTRLEPGESSSPLAFDTELDLPTVKSLLANSRNLMIGPATSVVEGDGTVNFELASTSINARTAEVIVDYGFARAGETYRVSTVAREGETSVTVDEVLTDILRIPYTQGTTQLRRERDGVPVDTEPNLLSVRGVGTSDADATMWTVIHSYPAESGASRKIDQYHSFGRGLDFGALKLQKGHVLELIRIVDTDRDGLGERSEFAYGTDPGDPDTDGDGCEDGFEVVGWDVGSAPNVVHYRSSPLLANTDFDLHDDCAEYRAGTDPNSADNTPPTVAANVSVADGVRATFEVTYDDAETDVLRLAYSVDGGAEQVLDLSGETSPAQIAVTFATSGAHLLSVVAEDGALRSQPAEVSYTVGAPAGGLTGHWPITGTVDGAYNGSLADSAGSNDLTASGVSLVSGRMGLGRSAADVRPNGDSGLITGNAGQLGDAFTLSLWLSLRSVYSDELVVGQGDRFAVAVGSSGDFTLYDQYEQTFTNKAVVSSGATAFENDGMFHNLVVVVSGGTATLYLDGASVGSGAIATGGAASSCSLFFGDLADGQPSCSPSEAQDHENGLNGTFDDIRLYGRALSANEVTALSLD